MKSKILITCLASIMAFNANAAPKANKVSSDVKDNVAIAYHYGANQKYAGEDVYYGNRDYGAEAIKMMKDKYGIDVLEIVAMCSQDDGWGISGKKKEPRATGKGGYCWCKLITSDQGVQPWSLNKYMSSNDSGYCQGHCVYDCASALWAYLSGTGMANAKEMVDNALQAHGN